MPSNFWRKRAPLFDVLSILALIWGGLIWYAAQEHPWGSDLEWRQTAIKDYLFPSAALSDARDETPLTDEEPAPLAQTDTAAAGQTASTDTPAPTFPVVATTVSTPALQGRTDTTTGVAAWFGPSYMPPAPLSDTASLFILLAGDSMCEGLMFALEKYCKFNGHKLKTRIWYGSSTRDWGKSDTLTYLIRRYRPSLVVFTTGSNELFIRNPGERQPFVRKVVEAADRAGVPFVWIGPPNWKEDTGLGEVLLNTVGEDRYFLSKHLSFQRGSDGAHPTRESSAMWADTIARWLVQTSRYKGKLTLDDPKTHSGRQSRPYQPPPSDSTYAAVRNDGTFKIKPADTAAKVVLPKAD